MLTKRQRIAAWIKVDAQRRAEAALVARTTERLFARPAPRRIFCSDPAALAVWSRALYRAAGP